MAKKKSKSSGGGRRSFGGGGTGRIIDGVIAGAGGMIVSKFLPLGAYTQPIADIVTGYYRKNDTLQTLGGRNIGGILAQGINMPFQTNGTALTGAGSLVG